MSTQSILRHRQRHDAEQTSLAAQAALLHALATSISGAAGDPLRHPDLVLTEISDQE